MKFDTLYNEKINEIIGEATVPKTFGLIIIDRSNMKQLKHFKSIEDIRKKEGLFFIQRIKDNPTNFIIIKDEKEIVSIDQIDK